ncbi:putative periplasmic lipoprotein [Pragia fontium]|uniref:Lipoprotein n=1 Tax=Pragia fontium DSM 5563 = ATCC 49100 TaxID=1122977 RepID=A0AAJ4WBD4_9GAMM|nr:hypothetical protein [Pragia fontium]SFC99728.1 hypothetical protein SAMN02745723_106175 [Pragia fontium DSM 5563 = ATCC 49100]VEJ55300.1 Uncharacterised protein [Pragia fontium]
MKRLILLAIAVLSLNGCASWNLTSESVKALSNDELCSRLGSDVQIGNVSAVALLLDEYKLRADNIDFERCVILERTGKQSVMPIPYYYGYSGYYRY